MINEELNKMVKKNSQKIEKAKENLLLHIKKQVTDAHESLSDLINHKLEGINEQIKKIDDKYKSMFGALISEFLVKLEKRTYENEIYMASLYRILIEETYKMQRETELSQDAFAEVVSERLAEVIEEEVGRFNSERKASQSKESESGNDGEGKKND